MGGISGGRGPEESWELKPGPRAWEDAEEPTREGGRPEPVERGLGAAVLPQALQSGIVHCPPIPQGSRQEGEAPGRKSTHRRHRGQVETEHIENARGQGIKRHETERKKKNRKKSGLVIVPTPGLGHTLEGGGRGDKKTG